jgi:hypothetical protein
VQSPHERLKASSGFVASHYGKKKQKIGIRQQGALLH